MHDLDEGAMSVNTLNRRAAEGDRISDGSAGQGLLGLPHAAGNRAVTDALLSDRNRLPVQRDSDEQVEEAPRPGDLVVPDTSRPAAGPIEGGIDPGEGIEPEVAMNYTALVAHAAAAKYDNPLHKELVYHYVYMKGARFTLTHEKMGQVIGAHTPRA